MTIFQAFILGIVQGITELLPISSSAHLILAPHFFGWQEHTLVFDTTLHLGTAFALLVYFSKDILKIVRAFLSDLLSQKFSFSKYSTDGLMGIKIVVGSVPAGLLGVLLGDFLENSFRSVSSVVIFLFLGSMLMLVAEKFYKFAVNRVADVTVKKSFIIGLFQSLALLPGFSRSGSSISGAMILGLSREWAAKFSFLLSIPIVLGAGIFQLHSTPIEFTQTPVAVVLTGLAASFLSGVLAIKFLMGYLAKHKLNVFIIYRIILILLILLAGR